MREPPIQRARRLRRDAPFPERLLWSRLRAHRFGGWKFRRQHPVGPYFADFACVALRLVIELDGDTHGAPAEVQRDAVRTAFLENEGWTVIRIWNADCLENLEGVLDRLEETMRAMAAQ